MSTYNLPDNVPVEAFQQMSRSPDQETLSFKFGDSIKSLNRSRFLKRGGCSKVYKIYICDDLFPVCVMKRSPNRKFDDKEIEILKQLGHENIIKFMGVPINRPNGLILEFCEEMITPKLGDFGLAVFGETVDLNDMVGSVPWMPWEYIYTLKSTPMRDVWSFGVFFWEMITCETPHKDCESACLIYLV
uniref:Protein kinase domain-containing protein n=1 Tax=Acrobeloides nanus TaxID=290746 RepID=A0A914E0W4_9BILA